MESSGNENKAGYMQDHTGQKSSTRVKSVVVLAFLLVFDSLYIFSYSHTVDWYFTAFNALLLVAAFVPQYLGKIIEIKK